MTWETPDGDRWLTGAEATMVRETLACMVDYVSENIRERDQERRWEFGVALFDEATPTQQLMIAKAVAEHLLTKTGRTLELTSINEAAVYAIFQTLAVQIEVEVDTEDDKVCDDEWRCYWRHLALAAANQCFADEGEEGLAVDRVDVVAVLQGESTTVEVAAEKNGVLARVPAGEGCAGEAIHGRVLAETEEVEPLPVAILVELCDEVAVGGGVEFRVSGGCRPP